MGYSLGRDAWLNAFGADDRIEALFAPRADVERMLAFERSLAVAQAGVGLIPEAAAVAIADATRELVVDMAALETRFGIDGVVPPALVAQLRDALAADARPHLHLGATSQDLIDTSVMIALSEAVTICAARAAALDEALEALAARHAHGPMLHARTRMQRALPISVAEKVANWRAPLAHLESTRPGHFPLQLGGPEGAARAFGEHYARVSTAMAAALGLAAPARHWHTNRQPLLDIAHWFAAAASAAGKLAQDVLVMAQTEVAELSVSGGGRSSAMPHKANPILAEVLLAQARHCHLLMGGLHAASVHENERSGSSWTLEWWLLPPLVAGGARALANAAALVGRLEPGTPA